MLALLSRPAGDTDSERRDVTRPLAVDLFTGCHGWAAGLVAEGYDVIGFDIEDMSAKFGQPKPPHFHLVIQDVRTLHGSQFRDAALIVASPPCQGYSYRAMPWKRAKALPPPDNELFDACFRIQREACEAAGWHIPMVVENVRGAQPWVGRSKWNYGSYHLWGDVPALMPITTKRDPMKVGIAHRRGGVTNFHGYKSTGNQALAGVKGIPHRPRGHWTNPAEHDGIKQGGTWWHDPGSVSRTSSSGSTKRKMASAMIARIPLPLARHIGACWRPMEGAP